MITSFLIATLVLFFLNLVLNLISLGIVLGAEDTSKAKQIGLTVFIYLIFVTWNIFALIAV